MTNIFDIKQNKAFQKGLRVGKFNNSRALKRQASMGEIRTKVEKHIEAKKDLVDQLQAKHETLNP
ncbi:hypothetical protein CR513_41473, partial [Mucuna pruriens]